MTTGTPTPFRVSVGELRPLANAIWQRGELSLPGILQDLGLPETLFTGDDDATLELADYFRLIGRLSQASGSETFPLSKRPLMSGSSDFVLSHIPGSSNLLEAMRNVANARNMLHGGTYNHVETDSWSIRFVVDDSHFPYAVRDERYIYFAVECVLILFHCTLMLLSSPELGHKLRRVHLRRPARPDPGGHLDFWDAPIRWHANTYALVYDQSAAYLPVPNRAEGIPPMSTLYRQIADLIDRRAREPSRPRSFTERTREILERGQHHQLDVARALCVSVATLRRRLEEEGVTFRALRQEVLNETAKTLLNRGEWSGEVAQTLGFADFRSFSRAFKSWNGVTPAGYVAHMTRRRSQSGTG